MCIFPQPLSTLSIHTTPPELLYLDKYIHIPIFIYLHLPVLDNYRLVLLYTFISNTYKYSFPINDVYLYMYNHGHPLHSPSNYISDNYQYNKLDNFLK